MVNAVFPIWPMTKPHNLCPKYLIEYRNVKIVKPKFKSEKIKKSKHSKNLVLKETRKKDVKIDKISVT